MTKPEIRIKSECPNDEALDFRNTEEDIASMKRAMQESREGKGRPVDVVFDELRERLLAMKARQERLR